MLIDQVVTLIWLFAFPLFTLCNYYSWLHIFIVVILPLFVVTSYYFQQSTWVFPAICQPATSNHQCDTLQPGCFRRHSQAAAARPSTGPGHRDGHGHGCNVIPSPAIAATAVGCNALQEKARKLSQAGKVVLRAFPFRVVCFKG